MESIRRDLAARFGEPDDMELPHLDTERWRELSENLDKIGSCIEKFCGIDPKIMEASGFRLEWHEDESNHRADYNNLKDAKAAQSRLRRMAKVIASIRPVA